MICLQTEQARQPTRQMTNPTIRPLLSRYTRSRYCTVSGYIYHTQRSQPERIQQSCTIPPGSITIDSRLDPVPRYLEYTSKEDVHLCRLHYQPYPKLRTSREGQKYHQYIRGRQSRPQQLSDSCSMTQKLIPSFIQPILSNTAVLPLYNHSTY